MPATAYFSHSTAAVLLGMPVQPRLKQADDLHLSVPSPLRAPHANRLVGHRSAAPVTVRTVHGVRISDPARTWCDLSTQVTTDHLVAAGDYLIHWKQPLLSVEELTAAVATATNRRGQRRQLEALPLLDDRAESAQESRLRFLLVTNGLTGLTVNHHVEDNFGEFVARTDIHIPALNLVLEYMGDYHRTTPGQWRADMKRRAKIELTGKRVMELNADDLHDPRELVARIWALAALVPR